MLTIINVLNHLTGGSTTGTHVFVKGKSLAAYIGFYEKCVVGWNGTVLELPIDEIMPADNETYTVVILPEGGDKQTWRVLGYVLISAAMFVPGTQALAWKGFYLTTFQKALIAGVGGNMINTLLRDKEKNFSQSPSYEWQHKENPTAAFGSAMPVIYGKARLRPTLKNRYVTTVGDKQYLYALYSLASHLVDETVHDSFGYSEFYRHGDIVHIENLSSPFHETLTEPGKTYRCITNESFIIGVAPFDSTDDWEVYHGTASFSEDIIINGRAIQNYGDDVQWETRPGLAEQIIITGFEATYFNTALDISLYGDAPVIDSGKASIQLVPTLFWTEHILQYQGGVYTIRHFNGAVFDYVYWKAPDTQYTLSNESTLDGYFLIAYYPGTGFKYTINKSIVPTSGSSAWVEPVTNMSDIHNIELTFLLPSGLFGFKSTGALSTVTCSLMAQYREQTADDSEEWVNFNFEFSKSTDEVDTTDTSGVHVGVVRKQTQKPVNVAVKALPDGEFLDSEKVYEVRTTAVSISIVKLVNVAGIVYGEKNAKGDRPGFTYPGEPLLGIKALASGQISGDLDVQVDVERSKVWVYSTRITPNAWVKVDANNHAWAVYDILVNGFYHTSSARIHPAYPDPNIEGYSWVADGVTYTTEAEAIYGCGIDPERIDFESFHDWADNIIDIEYELNIVFDTFMSAWDAILRICQEGRGMVYPVGTKIFAMSYKAQEVTQLFTMGNIHTDTFVQRYMDSGQKANMLEMKYWDADRNYQETLLSVKSADWDESGTMNQPTLITLYGTTDYTQTSSIARFIMETNRLLNNIISFAVDVDTLASQVGDVVEVNHDVLNLGTSGRVVSYSAGAPVTVVLDRDVTMTGAQFYALKVKHAATGTLEEKTAITVVGTGSSITFSSAFDEVIAKHDEYSFRATGTSTPPSSVHTQPAQLYQIIEISRSDELVRTLTLMQYDPAIYGEIGGDDFDDEFTDTTIIPPGDTVGVVANVLNLASNVRLEEILSKNRRTGEIQSSIAVLFDSEPPPAARGSWEIFFRDVDVSDINWKGTWVDDTYSTDEKVELNGITFISLENDNTTRPARIEA